MPDILLMIGRNIKRYRGERGFSQEKLAELSGLHRTYVGSVERGERNISIRNLERIAMALEIPVQFMFDFCTDAGESSLQK